ncbi:MAG: hypothetical protein AMJ54_08610 [Deltaproteobacteria bacterium SG8_13]|nr:MAG: hypothetical protein AMJ54_08610 [Deltaproteobacteria bacterium SG8_13]
MKPEILRIAMIGTKGIPARWGGIERYIEEIGSRLADRGHSVTVYGSRWYCAGYRLDAYRGIRICRVPSIPVKATDALINAFWASLAVGKSDIDIVQFHGFGSYYFVPFLRKCGKKVVVTAHGIESGWDNPKYGNLARHVLSRAFRIGVTRADAVTTVAEHLKQKLERQYQVHSEVMPSGVDEGNAPAPDLIEKEFGLHCGDYLLFLGRIDPIKRVDWVVDLLQHVRSRVKIVIAGGPQDATTRQYYDQLIGRVKTDSRIIFTGPVTGKKKAELLGNCALFLAPSSYEGLPITVLEAMSYHRCCIASDISAHREIIRHDQTGILFPRNDQVAFFRSVDRLLGLPEVAGRIGSSAKHYCRRIYSWDNTSIAYENLFRRTISEQKR